MKSYFVFFSSFLFFFNTYCSTDILENKDWMQKIIKEVFYLIKFPPYKEREELVIYLEERKRLEFERMKQYITQILENYKNIDDPENLNDLLITAQIVPNLGGLKIFYWKKKIFDYSYKSIENSEDFRYVFDYKNYEISFFLARKKNYDRVNFNTLAFNSDFFYFQQDGTLLYYQDKKEKYIKNLTQMQKKVDNLKSRNSFIFQKETKGFVLYIIPNFDYRVFFALFFVRTFLVVITIILIFLVFYKFLGYIKNKKDIYEKLEKILK